MSDKETPHHPAPYRYSHLHAEPVPISFASPQQLAAFTAGSGNLFGNPRMGTPMARFPPPMHTGYTMINPIHQNPMPQPSSPSEPTTPVASSKPVSTDSNVLKPLPPLTIDLATFKGLKFVTLDGLQIETREIYDKISGTFQWEMCESQDDRCINCIRDECQNRRVFLISSGGQGAKIVPEIHDLPQVYAIYIYCANVEAHNKWAKKFTKVRVVCDNDDQDLLPLFAVDVAQSNIDWGIALLKQGSLDRAREKFQLAKDKLKDHSPNHDPQMDVEIQKRLEECK